MHKLTGFILELSFFSQNDGNVTCIQNHGRGSKTREDPLTPCSANRYDNMQHCLSIDRTKGTEAYIHNKWIYVVNIYPHCCYLLIHRIIYINIS